MKKEDYQVVAVSGTEKGLLPMKESPEKEKLKSDEQTDTELCNFFKNSFVLDGQVRALYLKKPMTTDLVFECNDSKRGKFYVTVIPE